MSGLLYVTNPPQIFIVILPGAVCILGRVSSLKGRHGSMPGAHAHVLRMHLSPDNYDASLMKSALSCGEQLMALLSMIWMSTPGSGS